MIDDAWGFKHEVRISTLDSKDLSTPEKHGIGYDSNTKLVVHNEPAKRFNVVPPPSTPK